MDSFIIFDTTLRDGEQCPGAMMTLEQKKAIAIALEAMGVDIIEAGFAIASQGDFQAVNEIAKLIKNAKVCSLARAKKADIDACHQALLPAKNKRIHTFIATSAIHMEHQLSMSQQDVLEAIKESVSYARNLCDDVEWSAMDATRSDHDFLARCVDMAIQNGATTINIPDTVGYTLPQEYFALIKKLRDTVANSDKAIFSVHCHNDLGLAVANSLSALQAGARQVECTINGIGERAGNASLEEIIMATKTRPDLLPYQCSIDTTHIMKLSKLISQATGFVVQKNKAIVGENAFAHESGIHQDGVLKSPLTYEIMTPESVGLDKSKIILGKHSGRAAFKDRLNDLGINSDEKRFELLFQAFKDLGDKQKYIMDDDILALNQKM